MRFIIGAATKVLVMSATFVVLAATASLAESTTQSHGMYSQAWSRYMSAQELNTMISRGSDVQIIDIRKNKYVKKGTIPGALSMPFKQWRGPSSRPGQPPTEEALEAMLGAQGLDLDRPIVVHNHSGKTIQTGRAAIVYWILKSGGANQIAILNGGFKAWKAQGLPMATSIDVPVATSVDLTYRTDWWADPVEIFGVASGQANGAILDARLDAHVKKSIKTGKPMQSMPMARFISASFFMNPLADANTSKLGKEQFRSDLEARGIDLGDGFLISVCQTGELSALSWFYASEIVGLDKVLYYPDALQGWKSDGGLMFGLNPS